MADTDDTGMLSYHGWSSLLGGFAEDTAPYVNHNIEHAHNDDVNTSYLLRTLRWFGNTGAALHDVDSLLRSGL